MASPAGAPVSASQNHRYFEISGWGQFQGTVPLLGMSYEYLCHVLIPTSNTLATQYCQLATKPSFANWPTPPTMWCELMRSSTLAPASP
jgi:hypothetical protein